MDQAKWGKKSWENAIQIWENSLNVYRVQLHVDKARNSSAPQSPSSGRNLASLVGAHTGNQSNLLIFHKPV